MGWLFDAFNGEHFQNCTPWPWPILWMVSILNGNISETDRDSAKMNLSTFVDFRIYNRKYNITKIVLYNPDLLFECKMETLAFLKCLELAQKKIHRSSFVDVYIRHRSTTLQNCTPLPWPTFLRQRNGDANISEAVRDRAKTHEMTFVVWYLQSNDNIAKLYAVTLTYLLKAKQFHPWYTWNG